MRKSEEIMLEIYLVRHGQTLFNVKKKIQGWCDSPLTSQGILQAQALGIALKDIDFQGVYSSTSERAIDTALLIKGNREIPFQSMKGLKEINFGNLEGESEAILTDIVQMVSDGFENGESKEIVENRMLDSFNQIRTEHQNGKVLVVAHGGCIISVIEKIDPEAAKKFFKSKGIDNCSVSIITYDNEWRIQSVNQTEYRDQGLRVLQQKSQ